MKLFTSSIFYMITFLFIIGGRFTEVYSQYNHHPVPANIVLADLTQNLEDISYDINNLLFLPRLERFFSKRYGGDPDDTVYIACGYNQDTERKLKDMQDTMTSLREEFNKNALTFFDEQSEPYFVIFQLRLEYMRETLHFHLSNIVHCTYEGAWYHLKTFTHLTPVWGVAQ